MDVEAHDNDPIVLIRRARDWLNIHRKAAAPLPGGQALLADYAAYQRIAPDIIRELRLDPHDELSHTDYLYVVKTALPQIAAVRSVP